MLIYELATGDRIHQYNKCLVVKFAGKRKVMSTSMHNGGYKEFLEAVYNHDVNPGVGKTCTYCSTSEDEKKIFTEKELGLNYDKVAYMATIVSMDNAVVKTLSYDELVVTAVVTASLEVNGGRVGEEATSYEKRGKSTMLQPGTINTMVFSNSDMTPGCLARAIMTATEAKTAALQELMASSLRSTGIATGSGTDNIMVIANGESENCLTYAGKHGKLGELIGRTVMAAVKESLEKHMGLSVLSQHNMLARVKRYKISENDFIENISFDKAEALEQLHQISQDSQILLYTSWLVHLWDQDDWGLISKEETQLGQEILIAQLANYLKVSVPESSENGTFRGFIDCISSAIVNRLKNDKKGVWENEKESDNE